MSNKNNEVSLTTLLIRLVITIVVILGACYGVFYSENNDSPEKTKTINTDKTNNINKGFVGTWCAEHRMFGVPMHETLVFDRDKTGYLEINTLSLRDLSNKRSKKNFLWEMVVPHKVVKVSFEYSEDEDFYEIVNGKLRSKSSRMNIYYEKEE